MPLLKETTETGFDTDAIRRGDMIRAKYKSWDAPCNGIVAYATPEKIRVLYLTTTGFVSNFYTIHLLDVLDGLWEIQWASDFENVHTEGTEADNSGTEGTTEDNPGTEGNADGDP